MGTMNKLLQGMLLHLILTVVAGWVVSPGPSLPSPHCAEPSTRQARRIFPATTTTRTSSTVFVEKDSRDAMADDRRSHIVGDGGAKMVLAANRIKSLFAMATAAAVAVAAPPLVAMAAAIEDASGDVEFADLPPPYVPVVFGLVLLVGVGLLTGSLGNVIEEESMLGMQSGARAKKEMERSRSSYFRKK